MFNTFSQDTIWNPGVVSIIIVNWNTRELLMRCIEAVGQDAAGLDLEIIVVDNASSDGSAKTIREHYSEVKLITNTRNLGFAVASNQGIKESKGEYILLLNPDAIVQPGAVRGLVCFLSDQRSVGIVGPLLYGTDGQVQISSFGMTPSPIEAAMRAFRIWRLAPKSKLARRFLTLPEGTCNWTETEHLLGACMLIRRDVVEQIGGLDEGFFLFLEETDFCCRAKDSGWKLAYYTGVAVTHIGEQSMQNILHRSGGLYIRSYNRFCRKRGMNGMRRAIVNVFLIAAVATDALVGLVKYRNLTRSLQGLAAIWYGYIGNPQPKKGSVLACPEDEIT